MVAPSRSRSGPFRIPLLALPVLLVLGSCMAPPDPEIRAVELRGHVDWLASDRLEGRRAGTPSADRAADYLAARLAAAGLEPGGPDGSWFQEFRIDMPPEAGACSLVVDGRPCSEVGTVMASATASVAAPLVSAGFGTIVPETGEDDFAAAGVSGKIALIRRYSMFGPHPDPQHSGLGNLREKIRNAAHAGAVGVVLGTHPEEIAAGGSATIPFEGVPGTMPIPVVTVPPQTFARLEEEAESGAAPEARLSAEVLRHQARTRNVLALAPGTRDGFIVVGAHYDHLGWGGDGSLAPGVHAVHNGADDNASGTATVLELAEEWGTRKSAPAGRGVLFALWSGEEEGLLGSEYWVAHPTLPLDRVVCNLNLDMVGRPKDALMTVGSANTCAAFAPALRDAREALAARGSDLRLDTPQDSGLGGGGSDHMSFQNAKIPALFFFSGLHSDYHKPSDDADKLDYPRMADLGAAVTVLLDDLRAAPREQFAYVAPQRADEHANRRVSGARVWFGSIPDYGAAPEGGGMKISGTAPGGPAERAGLQEGDVIRAIGEYEVGDIYDFMDALAHFHDGDTVEVKVLRKGEEVVLPLTFFPRPSGD